MSSSRPLWAPWRMEYIRTPKDNDCFLCNNQTAGSGKPEEELLIHRGETAFVMLNRFPYTCGHLLIAPYRHTGKLSDLSEKERLELINLCIFSQQILEEVMKPEAYNIGFNIGKAAGAGNADHLHMHLVPRWNGDTNFMPVLADVRCVPEALTTTAEMIRNAWIRKERTE